MVRMSSQDPKTEVSFLLAYLRRGGPGMSKSRLLEGPGNSM